MEINKRQTNKKCYAIIIIIITTTMYYDDNMESKIKYNKKNTQNVHTQDNARKCFFI